MTGYAQKRGSHGRRIGVFADLPIKHACECPEPVVYRDEDDDPCCFRCGQAVNPSAARVLG